MTTEPDILRREIAERVQAYYESAFPSRAFAPGETPVPVSGKVFDARELQHLVDSALDFWLTSGRFANSFEKKFAAFIGVKHALLVNSGSSANLLAISALTSPMLGKRRLKAGDEVITVAAGFPTTVNPIIQNHLVPVFVDVALPTYNIDADAMEAALSEKTRAVILAHTLGNPFDVEIGRAHV
jgi:CDP-6-deoxy-D-xylo-4-hexulose-3-dehydrase